MTDNTQIVKRYGTQKSGVAIWAELVENSLQTISVSVPEGATVYASRNLIPGLVHISDSQRSTIASLLNSRGFNVSGIAEVRQKKIFTLDQINGFQEEVLEVIERERWAFGIQYRMFVVSDQGLADFVCIATVSLDNNEEYAITQLLQLEEVEIKAMETTENLEQEIRVAIGMETQEQSE